MAETVRNPSKSSMLEVTDGGKLPSNSETGGGRTGSTLRNMLSSSHHSLGETGRTGTTLRRRENNTQQ